MFDTSIGKDPLFSPLLLSLHYQDDELRLISGTRFITTPLLLLDLLLTAALPWPTILFTLLVNEVMIVTGLVGALVQSSYKVFTLRQARRRQTLTRCICISGAILSLVAWHCCGWHMSLR